MLASKSEEVAFIHLDSVIKNVIYNKFTKEQLQQTQLDVMQIIDYKVNTPTIYELCTCAFRMFTFKSEKIKKFFEDSTLLVAMTCLFWQKIQEHFTYAEISGLSMIMVLKIIEKIDSDSEE